MQQLTFDASKPDKLKMVQNVKYSICTTWNEVQDTNEQCLERCQKHFAKTIHWPLRSQCLKGIFLMLLPDQPFMEPSQTLNPKLNKSNLLHLLDLVKSQWTLIVFISIVSHVCLALEIPLSFLSGSPENHKQNKQR